MKIKKTASLIILFLIALQTFSQRKIEGYIYEDTNLNKKKDRTEKGISGVAVSNGKDVTITDHKGKYTLEIGDDNIIFVIKPKGYKFPLDEYNMPQSYYIHKPEGSPLTKYEGVLPTGSLPLSLDFGMIKYDEPETFSTFIFGDSQVYSEQEVDFFEKGIVDEAKENPNPVFGITLGDLVGNDLSLHPSYKKAIKQMNRTWYNVIGNHDLNFDAKNDSLSDETFERNFGPATHSFNYGKAHFIVLDDVLYPNPNPAIGGAYLGGLREDQFTFIENDLKYIDQDCLIIIATHIPFLDVNDRKAFRESDQQRLFQILHKYPNVLILSAHTHIQAQNLIHELGDIKREKPIHEYNVGTTCGDWYSGLYNEQGVPISTMRDGTPRGYAYLNIDGNKYTLDYKVADQPKSYQINIYNPKVVPYKGRWITSGIYANFFMGKSGDKLEYRVDNGKWSAMEKVEEYDPSYYKYMQDWDFYTEVMPMRRPSKAEICQHLWFAKIPSNLSVGTHTIEVRATDMFGRIHTQKSDYEIK